MTSRVSQTMLIFIINSQSETVSVRSSGVSVDELEKVYASVMESFLIFNISVVYGHMSKYRQTKQDFKAEGKITGLKQKQLR